MLALTRPGICLALACRVQDKMLGRSSLPAGSAKLLQVACIVGGLSSLCKLMGHWPRLQPHHGFEFLVC